MSETLPTFPLYDAACRALTKAVSVNEVMQIRDAARALEACAKVAKNRNAEADAVVLRLRAVRRLGQLQQAQKDTVGFNKGAAGGGKKSAPRGRLKIPRDLRPTLASQGIDKNLAQQARTLGPLSDENFEAVIDDAHDKVRRAVRNAVREVEILQEREAYAGRTEQGGTVADLEALAASGFKAGVICPDFPWKFKAYSNKGKQRSAERYYRTWPPERILATAPLIKQLAAPDCALVLWAVWPDHPLAFELIKACDFEYKTVGFVWVKTTKNAEAIALDGKGLHTGEGLTGTRSNTEVCLLATRGSPLRLSADVHQVVIAPVGAHSEKPDEVYRRIERLYPGPRLEMFARKLRPSWMCWGDELPPPAINTATPVVFDWAAPPLVADSDDGIPGFLRRGAP